jgi:DNA mismatch repair protein MutS
VTTPLRRQYLEIKRRYPHAILFFRLGDFYETFDEDAETVARELEITLTSRPVSKGERVPLAGIPYHSLDSYLGKLIAKGYKVAICEQTEPPARGKKLVDRRVVRVVTPGTLVEDNLLAASDNNFLAALAEGEGEAAPAGLAWLDVSTGEFRCLQAERGTVRTEAEKLQPAELLLPPDAAPPLRLRGTLTPLPAFDPAQATAALLRHFGAPGLDALGLASSPLAAAAAGAVIEYVRENQPASLGHIVRISSEPAAAYMAVDANTRRNLEIFEPLAPAEGDGRPGMTLVGVLDHTKTAMGARLLRRWLGRPLLDVTAISARQDAVEYFCRSAVGRAQAGAILARIPDLERIMARTATATAAGPTAQTARDLVGLRRALEGAAMLRATLEEAADEVPKGLAAALHDCRETAELIAAAVEDDPAAERAVRPGFSGELDSLRSLARDARQLLAALEAGERERTGIKSLKVGYNRVFGYYIEVSKANAGAVPGDYQRKQTLVGGERYTTPALQELEYRILDAQERLGELEEQILGRVCAQAAAQSARIMETAAAAALVDVYCSLAEAASRYGYVRPTVDESDLIAVRDGRHPVVERMLPDGSFVPNDTEMSASNAQIIVLTGPNMAGKSTYLRQVALIVLMAQAGSFVPAAQARIGLADRLASRVGALDDIASGRSTFMAEMLETASMLHSATPRSLLIFDEIGRGTSTYDGMAIARAVVEFLHNRPGAAPRSLFATHYHELTQLASVLPRVRNYNVAVAEESGVVVFLHRILPGGADRSYGVHVAQLAGLPRPVVLRAREILEELESSRDGARPAPREERALQMQLFQADGALRRELSALDVDAMTPLQAITKLYELVERARAGA